MCSSCSGSLQARGRTVSSVALPASKPALEQPVSLPAWRPSGGLPAPGGRQPQKSHAVQMEAGELGKRPLWQLWQLHAWGTGTQASTRNKTPICATSVAAVSSAGPMQPVLCCPGLPGSACCRPGHRNRRHPQSASAGRHPQSSKSCVRHPVTDPQDAPWRYSRSSRTNCRPMLLHIPLCLTWMCRLARVGSWSSSGGGCRVACPLAL